MTELLYAGLLAAATVGVAIATNNCVDAGVPDSMIGGPNSSLSVLFDGLPNGPLFGSAGRIGNPRAVMATASVNGSRLQRRVVGDRAIVDRVPHHVAQRRWHCALPRGASSVVLDDAVCGGIQCRLILRKLGRIGPES